jgi:biopolymer transport protein ExbB
MIINILLEVTETLNKLKVEQIPAHKLTFFELMIKGGPILIPIGILSLITVYLISEKYFSIHSQTSVSSKTRKNFIQAVSENNSEKALSTLKSESGAYSTIFNHGIDHIQYSPSEIEKELESVSNIEMSRIGKNLSYLGLIAGIAPMLGFIGTISGIIKIFYNISVTDNISIGIISGGLYEKMISSGSGLIVGVIAYTGYHMLNMKIDKFSALVETDAFNFLTLVKKQKINN